MAIDLALFLVGFGIIFKGAGWFVNAATEIARGLRLPKLLVGATIVSFATVAPELFVSLTAALLGKTGMAAGNAIGSPITNVGLIFAGAVCFRFLPVSGRVIREEGVFMLGSAALLLVVARWRGALEPPVAVLFLVLTGWYFYLAARKARLSMKAESNSAGEVGEFRLRRQAVLFTLGSAMVILGSRILVASGARLAAGLGVSESLIGLTVIAFGTSLPEFFTSLTALSRGHREIAVGNILGANILDVTLVFGVTGLTGRIPLDDPVSAVAIPTLLLLSALFIVFGSTRKGFQRWEGAVMLAFFLGYTARMIALGTA